MVVHPKLIAMVRRVLFVSYGAGHIAMVLPVMRALNTAHPDWELLLFAPTTAAFEAKRNGQTCLTYRDFANWYDPERLQSLASPLLRATAHPNVSVEESVAYLGINLAELQDRHGVDEANRRYEKTGRWAFYPFDFMQRVIRSLKVGMVIATNSPRTEAAALEAASALGLPTLCMVDLFSPAGDPFLKRLHYADTLTTISQLGRDNLVSAGIPSTKIRITGNPAFDSISAPIHQNSAYADKVKLGWENKKIILWPGHLEIVPPEFAQIADACAFPVELQLTLVNYVISNQDTALVIRFHPNHVERFRGSMPQLPNHPRIFWSEPAQRHPHRDIHLSDICVVQATTVALEAAIAGKSVLSLDNSPSFLVFPCSKQGISRGVSSFTDLVNAIDMACAKPFTSLLFQSSGSAAKQVSDIISTNMHV